MYSLKSVDPLIVGICSNEWWHPGSFFFGFAVKQIGFSQFFLTFFFFEKDVVKPLKTVRLKREEGVERNGLIILLMEEIRLTTWDLK